MHAQVSSRPAGCCKAGHGGTSWNHTQLRVEKQGSTICGLLAKSPCIRQAQPLAGATKTTDPGACQPTSQPAKQPLTIRAQPATRAHARWKCWAQLRSAHLRVAPFWPQWLQRVALPRRMAPGRCSCSSNRQRQATGDSSAACPACELSWGVLGSTKNLPEPLMDSTALQPSLQAVLAQHDVAEARQQPAILASHQQQGLTSAPDGSGYTSGLHSAHCLCTHATSLSAAGSDSAAGCCGAAGAAACCCSPLVVVPDVACLTGGMHTGISGPRPLLLKPELRRALAWSMWAPGASVAWHRAHVVPGGGSRCTSACGRGPGVQWWGGRRQ